MPKKLKTTHQIIPQQLVVYQRPTSDVWQCRYKVDGKWLVSSTRERVLEKAKVAAHKLLLKAEVRIEQNYTLVTKKFKDVALLTLKAMDEKMTAGEGKMSYEQYKRITNDYLIPFFGKRDVDTITQKVLQDYAKYREQKMGKAPAYSTVRKHNVALNRIFEEAVHRSFMTTTQRPYLETKGKKSEPYATFEVEEINVILSAMPEWIAKGRNEYKRELRQILFDYVQVLIDTGARPGKELLDLQWKNISIKRITQHIATVSELNEAGELVEVPVQAGFDDEGEPIYKTVWDAELILYVDGKTEGRKANGFTATYNVLQRIAQRRYKNKTARQMVEARSADFLFATKDGIVSKSFNHMFEDFLEAHNLLHCPNTGKNRVFYSIRSAHSTAVMNLDGVAPRDLALQLGNSAEVIQKHYDRADGAAITSRVRAPNARAELFKNVSVPDNHKPAAKKKKSSKSA